MENPWKQKKEGNKEVKTVAEKIRSEPGEVKVQDTKDKDVKLVTIESVDDNGKRIRIIKKVRTKKQIKKVKKCVHERTKLKPFGIAITGVYENFNTGGSAQVETSIDYVPFVKPQKSSQEECEKVLEEIIREYTQELSDGSSGEHYVAPHEKREGVGMNSGGYSRYGRREDVPNSTLRISNISAEMGKDQGLIHGLLKVVWLQVIYLRLYQEFDSQLKAFMEERNKYKKRLENARKALAKEEEKADKDPKALEKLKETVKKLKDTVQKHYDKQKKLTRQKQLVSEMKKNIRGFKAPKPGDKDYEYFTYLKTRINNLKEACPYRNVVRKVHTNHDNRDGGFYCFVNFQERMDAEDFMTELKGKTIHSLEIRVEWDKQRKRRY